MQYYYTRFVRLPENPCYGYEWSNEVKSCVMEN